MEGWEGTLTRPSATLSQKEREFSGSLSLRERAGVREIRLTHIFRIRRPREPVG